MKSNDKALLFDVLCEECPRLEGWCVSSFLLTEEIIPVGLIWKGRLFALKK